MNRLRTRVLDGLESVMGYALTRVLYRPLEHECGQDHIDDPDLYIGGEIALIFDVDRTRFISWDENAGWESHFSVQVSTTSTFLPGCLEEYDASKTRLWAPALGRRLTTARCLGWEDSPHVLEFTFGEVVRWVGSASQTRFGDGDDLLFCGQPPMLLGTAKVLWQSDREGEPRHAP